MKGFPPLEMLLVAALFAVALFPLLRLTGEQPPLHPSPPQTTSNTTTTNRPQLTGTVRFSHPPTSFTITPDDHPPTSSHDFSWTGYPDGCEIHLAATWPEGTPAVAIEVTVEPEGINSQSQTLWANNPADDYLTFFWHPASTPATD